MTIDVTAIETSSTESVRANCFCSPSNRKEQKMSEFCDTALGFLTDVLETEYPEAAIFLRSEKGQDDHSLCMQAHDEFGNRFDTAYHAAVSALWWAQSDFQEAGDFLNSRNVRSIYFDRVGEEIRKAKLEVERAKRDEVERRTRLKEKLDRLTNDGVLTNEEREELDRAPFLGGSEDDFPF